MDENNNYPDPVDSRSVEIIETIINQEEYDIPPQSRLEEVLLELKEAIEQGGGGSGNVYVTTTPLTDGATTNPILVNGESVTVDTGDIAVYSHKEFIWDGSAWDELGDLSGDYSTTEQDTGRKWIDGKPIYQKTFVPTAPATSWEGINNTVDVSGLNIDTLINTEAQAQNASNGNYYSLSMVSTPSNTIVMTPNKSDILVYLGDSNLPTRVFNFTIQYTKTTDTVE